ncbi:MAG: FAD-dependent monooxygenase, partial [Ardenticatenales bacterium]
ALRTGGAGLWLWPNALHAIDALGQSVGRAVRGAGIVQTSNRVRDARGRTLVRVAVARADGQLYRSLSIRRAALLAALAAALPPDAIRFGAAVTGVDVGDANAGATVHLADGTAWEADLVVAADGVGSAIRAALFGDSGRRDAGFTAFRAVVPFPGAANVDGGVVWGRGCRFGVLAVAEDCMNWFAGFTAPANLEPADRLAVIRARFAGWPDPVCALLDATGPGDVRADRLEYCTPPPAWSLGRVALLGDAAHAMTPSLGQGAGQALEDAVALGEAVAADPGDIAAALAAYGRRRKRRAADVAARSIRMDRLVQIESPLLCAVRNRIVALVPPPLVRRFHRSMWGLPWPDEVSEEL